MTTGLRLGTRASALALAQSGQVADALRRMGHSVVLVPLVTDGDRDDRPLPGRAHEGIFVSSVRDALLDGSVDLAVHSYKDLPTEEVTGLTIAAVPRRADPRDVLVSRAASLQELPAGGRVGTCSVRRAAWVLRSRPDLVVVPIRGNIDRRIRRLIDSEFDAIVLAAAGLQRLGCPTPGTSVIPIDDLVPAPAQGALAIECRTLDTSTRMAVQCLDHPASHLSAVAERAVLAAIDPSDSTPVGATSTMRQGALRLTADICDPDGSARTLVRVRAPLPRTGDSRMADAQAAATLAGERAAECLLRARDAVAVAS